MQMTVTVASKVLLRAAQWPETPPLPSNAPFGHAVAAALGLHFFLFFQQLFSSQNHYSCCHVSQCLHGEGRWGGGELWWSTVQQ